MREVEINIPEEVRPGAYCEAETQKRVYPEGVRPRTVEFIEDGIRTGAFDTLPTHQQELISLYFGTEISTKKIGRQMGVPKVTAFRRVRYAMRELHKAL